MNKISSLARMGIAHRCFGNPIPQAAYDLIEATEKCVEDFNPPNKNETINQELLEALQQCLPHLREQAKSDGHAFGTLQLANRIIAKALGETE